MFRRTLTILALIMLPVAAIAQKTSTAETQYDVKARLSGELDWKIRKGLHLSLQEEARFNSNISNFDKLYSSLEASYKVTDWLKAGSGYTIINSSKGVRHRGTFALTASKKTGQWTFSWREKLQLTRKSYEINTFQEPQTLWALKSRIKAAYKIPGRPWEPYAAAELKHFLNAVNYKSLATTPELAGTVKYNDLYMNRARLALGAEWRMDKSNFLDFYTLLDYKYNKDIDTNRAGRLEIVTFEPSWSVCIGIAYRFAM